jgi:hypothetical protein
MLGTQGKMLTTVLTVQNPSGTQEADEFYAALYGTSQRSTRAFFGKI